MNVVLDACVLFDQWDFRSHSIELFVRFILDEKHKVFIPEVVILECVSNFRKRFKENLVTLERALGSFRVISDRQIDIEKISEKEAVAAYEERLKKWIDRIGAQTLSLDVPLRSIVNKAIRQEKPFGSKNRDCLRDAIVWANTLSVVNASEKTVLVTSNWEDFAEASDAAHFHVDLIADLSKLAATDTTSLCKSFDELTDEYRRKLNVRNDIRDRIRANNYDEFHISYFMPMRKLEVMGKIEAEMQKIPEKHFAPFSPALERRLLELDSWRISIRTVMDIGTQGGILIELELNAGGVVEMVTDAKDETFGYWFQGVMTKPHSLGKLCSHVQMTCALSLVQEKTKIPEIDVRIERFGIRKSGDGITIY